MNKLITLITPTGGRQVAFSQCEKYIKNQTIFGKKEYPIQWVVVDDCEPRTVCNLGQEYYRGPKVWSPGINTQRFNMDQAISHVKGDYIFVIEDDDYYSPQYLETMLTLLKYAPIVGEGVAKYYHLRVPGHKVLNNYENASLCQTALRKDYIQLLNRSINSGHFYFDIEFWKEIRNERIPAMLLWNLNLSVGIKGMPGRSGATGNGHEDKGYYYDSNFSKLKELVGVQTAVFYIGVHNAINQKRTRYLKTDGENLRK